MLCDQMRRSVVFRVREKDYSDVWVDVYDTLVNDWSLISGCVRKDKLRVVQRRNALKANIWV